MDNKFFALGAPTRIWRRRRRRTFQKQSPFLRRDAPNQWAARSAADLASWKKIGIRCCSSFSLFLRQEEGSTWGHIGGGLIRKRTYSICIYVHKNCVLWYVQNYLRQVTLSINMQAGAGRSPHICWLGPLLETAASSFLLLFLAEAAAVDWWCVLWATPFVSLLLLLLLLLLLSSFFFVAPIMEEVVAGIAAGQLRSWVPPPFKWRNGREKEEGEGRGGGGGHSQICKDGRW